MTNTTPSLSSDTNLTHTHVDFCDACAAQYVSTTSEPVTITFVHDPALAGVTDYIYPCTICRRPAKRWIAETANNA